MADNSNALEDFMRRMEIAKAPAWMPEPGQILMGEVIGLSLREGDYGPYPVVTYRKIDSAESPAVVNLHAFHGMIRERLAELETDIGSVHIVTYLGKRAKTKTNVKGEIEEYHDYYVEDMNTAVPTTVKPEGFSFT